MKHPAIARQEQAQQTRARLVEAALRVFAEEGYDRATVEEISLAAGYSKGAYYFHFDSKEDIFLELLSTWVDSQTGRLKVTGRRPVATELLEMLSLLLRYDGNDHHWQLLLPEIWAQSNRNPRVRETLRGAYAKWIVLLQKLFEKANGEGLISLSVKPNIAASLVLAAHDGLILRSLLTLTTEGEFTPSEVANALLNVILTVPPQGGPHLVAPAVRRTVRRKK